MGCVSVRACSPAEECVFHREYSLGRKLGEGAFGQVRAARLRGNTWPEAVELAVKIVDARMQDARGEPLKRIDRERVSYTQMEIEVWQAVGRHPNCVHLQASFFERSLFFMVMEKCNCSLMDKLSRMDSMTESELLRMFTQMLLGIEHVHGVDIVHRDIKPDNFLQGGEDGTTVKLCDFGLACRIVAGTPLKGVYGTAPYMSPEMLQGGGYGKLTDVWSFGATAFLMVHGDFPYSPPQATAHSMKKAILSGRPAIRFVRESTEDLLFHIDLVDRATPFLQALLQRASSTRPSATEALRLPFLSADGRRQSKPVTNSTAAAPLAPAIRKARKATCELRRPANPIVQRKLDELLGKLQDRLGASTGTPASLYFSENDDMAWTPSVKEQTEGRILRWSTSARRASHSGVVSTGMDEKVSDVSTTAPEGSGSATPPTPSSPDSGSGGRLRSQSL